MTRRAGYLSCILIFGMLVMLKPAVLKMDDTSRLLVLLRWQTGKIQFVNSVTGRPVLIHFRIGGLFRHFGVVTDETTEDYYTNGTYSMNEAVSKESTNTLKFCSMKGISLTLGFYRIFVKDGCLEVKLLWTM